jgi:hypothetical protein
VEPSYLATLRSPRDQRWIRAGLVLRIASRRAAPPPPGAPGACPRRRRVSPARTHGRVGSAPAAIASRRSRSSHACAATSPELSVGARSSQRHLARATVHRGCSDECRRRRRRLLRGPVPVRSQPAGVAVGGACATRAYPAGAIHAHMASRRGLTPRSSGQRRWKVPGQPERSH